MKSLVKKSPNVKRMALWTIRNLAAVARSGPFALLGFYGELRRYRALGGKARTLDAFPCLADRTEKTNVDRQYFHQAAWAARLIVERGVKKHVDVGSSVMFLGVIAAFCEVDFIDIRPLDVTVRGLSSRKGSLLDMPFPDEALQSVSCLHVIEHVGLGRYGDPLDPYAFAKAASELSRVIAPGGQLLLSTPIGRPRIQFNGQRIFGVEEVLAMFPMLTLESVAIVDAHGEYHDLGGAEEADIREEGAGADFGLGMFCLRRNE